MKRFKFSKVFLAIIIGLSFGCSGNVDEPKDDGNETEEKPEVGLIPINISMKPFSRVTDTSYEVNDKVGIYVVNYVGDNPGILSPTGNHADNIGFTYKEDWIPDKEVYWKDNATKADFYCYYPFCDVDNVEAVPCRVQTDQSSIGNYKKSEFLWGKAFGITPTSSAVHITTNRIVSCMIIDIKPGKGYTQEELASADIDVEICNVQTYASLNLKNGSTTPSGELNNITPYKTEGSSFKALMIPQNVDAANKLVSISIDGVEYTYSKEMEFKPNKKHTFTITVNKVDGSIDIGIGGWEENEEDYGGSAE